MIALFISGEELPEIPVLLPLCHDGNEAFIGQYSNLRDTKTNTCNQKMMCKFNCSIGASAEFVNTKCSIMHLDKSMLLLHDHNRRILVIGDSYAEQLFTEAHLWCHQHIKQANYCNMIMFHNAPLLTQILPPFTANETLAKALIVHPNTTDIIVTTGNHWGPLKGFINTTETAQLYQEMLTEAAHAINRWNPNVHLIWYDIPPPHQLLIVAGPNQILYNQLAKETLKLLIKHIIFLNTSEFILERIRLQPHATTKNRHYCQGHKGSVPEALLTRILSLLAAWI